MKKREINKIANGFINIQKVIDQKIDKLYDKQKNLELSHNRKIKLLEKIEKFLKILKKEEKMDEFGKAMIEELLFKINNELTFIGQVKGIF